jgi:hypothetical protein
MLGAQIAAPARLVRIARAVGGTKAARAGVFAP